MIHQPYWRMDRVEVSHEEGVKKMTNMLQETEASPNCKLVPSHQEIYFAKLHCFNASATETNSKLPLVQPEMFLYIYPSVFMVIVVIFFFFFWWDKYAHVFFFFLVSLLFAISCIQLFLNLSLLSCQNLFVCMQLCLLPLLWISHQKS